MTICKIATCTVTRDGYGDLEGTHQRMHFLTEATSELSKMGIDLFVLPGGYLFSSGGADIKRLQTEVVELASNTGVDLIVGIDETRKDTSPGPEIIKRGKLGALAIFATHNGQVAKWRQRTNTSKNQYLVSDDICRQEWLIRTKPRIENLICGEIFNKRIREGLTGRKAVIVIDQGHTAAKFRVFEPMKILASKGISCLCSVHADVQRAVKHCYVPNCSGWKKKSSREIDLTVGEKPRLEIKVWKFDSTGRLQDA